MAILRNRARRHRADQLPLLARKELRTAWRTRAEVAANAESRDVF